MTEAPRPMALLKITLFAVAIFEGWQSVFHIRHYLGLEGWQDYCLLYVASAATLCALYEAYRTAKAMFSMAFVKALLIEVAIVSAVASVFAFFGLLYWLDISILAVTIFLAFVIGGAVGGNDLKQTHSSPEPERPYRREDEKTDKARVWANRFPSNPRMRMYIS